MTAFMAVFFLWHQCAANREYFTKFAKQSLLGGIEKSLFTGIIKKGFYDHSGDKGKNYFRR